ncbi:hypothetical protein MNQ98_04410 [Paenibacillus sp. N3/727]|uniref:hypothetical protein n=1 Tax=Paenibacillus sp. N3/727 TaxID=2925845 RepID=UPI001F539C3F|nr:hypothetical protein [Paenibacillus sp. N3/727]UNK19287.1 hypothetical protein MNQ98_04410 [Paenibacillus sp. N3/727]
MKQKVLLIILVLMIISGCGATYDLSIHTSKVNEIVNNNELTKYISYYEPLERHDILVQRSEKKISSEYVDGEVYEYTVLVDVNDAFLTASRTTQFDFVDRIADIFDDSIAGEGTSFIGIYDKVIITTINDDPNFAKSMNIHEVRKLDNETRDEYRLAYYDSEGKPVYE